MSKSKKFLAGLVILFTFDLSYGDTRVCAQLLKVGVIRGLRTDPAFENELNTLLGHLKAVALISHYEKKDSRGGNLHLVFVNPLKVEAIDSNMSLITSFLNDNPARLGNVTPVLTPSTIEVLGRQTMKLGLALILATGSNYILFNLPHPIENLDSQMGPQILGFVAFIGTLVGASAGLLRLALLLDNLTDDPSSPLTKRILSIFQNARSADGFMRKFNYSPLDIVERPKLNASLHQKVREMESGTDTFTGQILFVVSMTPLRLNPKMDLLMSLLLGEKLDLHKTFKELGFEIAP